MPLPMAKTHPEVGRPIVEGIAMGRAIVWAGDPPPRDQVGAIHEERARLVRALARATRGVRDLARTLPPAEAELFEPELSILAERDRRCSPGSRPGGVPRTS
jgi:hypothetical protein